MIMKGKANLDLPITVLGIAASPRRGGNSDLLLERALEGAAQAGANVERIIAARLKIGPCIACDGCWETGRCVVQDEYQMVYPKLLTVERIILASPIYFMAISAQGKLLIDRCQCLWARKYVLHQPLPPTLSGEPRRGALITTAGHSVPSGFRCAATTMRYLLDTLDAEFAGELHVGYVDEKGAIREHPDMLEAAYALGKQLLDSPTTKEATE
jgi:multimeric flavodoxin WrbA